MMSLDEELKVFIDKVIKAYPQAVADLKAGQNAVNKLLIGQVLREAEEERLILKDYSN